MNSSQAVASPLSLEEHLHAICGLAPDGRIPGLGIRRLARSPVDARLFFPSPSSLTGELGKQVLEQLSRDPWIESARRKGGTISLRLSDAFIESLGVQVEHDERVDLARIDSLANRSYVVNFLNPNATKPLHIGHLRNVAIGLALASTLEACGSKVVRQCYVCDIGRNVCEAVAGYEQFHAGETPETRGVPPDQFVGHCYAEYVGSMAGELLGADAATADPIASETSMANDRADELVRDWASGGAGTRALWARIRGWALAGQASTLARLGVWWDRVHYESTSMDTVQEFVERGLRTGLFVRGSGGAVIYETERAEYETLQLVREDGFPTEHARVIGLFLEEQAGSSDADAWIVVCGDEWGTAGAVELDIADRLGAGALVAKVEVVAHGMVTVSGSKMKSRDGRAILIDDFLNGLADSPDVQRTLAEFDGPVTAEAVVDLLVKGYFLSRKVSKGVEFHWEAFTDETRNPAWIVARAWCRANRRSAGAEPFDAERYRTAVMQILQYRQLLARSSEGFQGTPLMKFANGLAGWYLAGPSDQRLDRVMRSILGTCLRSLGIDVGAGAPK